MYAHCLKIENLRLKRGAKITETCLHLRIAPFCTTDSEGKKTVKITLKFICMKN